MFRRHTNWLHRFFRLPLNNPGDWKPPIRSLTPLVHLNKQPWTCFLTFFSCTITSGQHSKSCCLTLQPTSHCLHLLIFHFVSRVTKRQPIRWTQWLSPTPQHSFLLPHRMVSLESSPQPTPFPHRTTQDKAEYLNIP